MQNTDPLPDRSKQEEKKPCNVLHLEVQNEQYYKKLYIDLFSWVEFWSLILALSAFN